MNSIAKPLALLALLATILPPAMFMLDGLRDGAKDVPAASSDDDAVAKSDNVEDQQTTDEDAAAARFMTESRMQNIMLAGAILWFVAAPAWLKEND
jgi:hypothetical protein